MHRYCNKFTNEDEFTNEEQVEELGNDRFGVGPMTGKKWFT
jgi:hypothetical protein